MVLRKSYHAVAQFASLPSSIGYSAVAQLTGADIRAGIHFEVIPYMRQDRVASSPHKTKTLTHRGSIQVTAKSLILMEKVIATHTWETIEVLQNWI